MDGKKLYFLFNPTSGKGRIREHLLEIVDIFTKAGYEVTVHPTQAQGDAQRLTEELADEYDLIVCSGGDGNFP